MLFLPTISFCYLDLFVTPGQWMETESILDQGIVMDTFTCIMKYARAQFGQVYWAPGHSQVVPIFNFCYVLLGLEASTYTNFGKAKVFIIAFVILHFLCVVIIVSYFSKYV